MKWPIPYLQSMLARRILLLFILCALLPIATLGVLSLYQVSGELRESTYERLNHTSKNIGMTILEGLTFLNSEIKEFALPEEWETDTIHTPSKIHHRAIFQRFRSLTVLEGSSKGTILFGNPFPLPSLDSSIVNQLVSGRTMIYSIPGNDQSARIFMVVAISGKRSVPRFLVGEINPEYLWELVNRSLPSLTEATIIDSGGNQLYSTYIPPQGLIDRAKKELKMSVSGRFEWQHGDETYLSNYRSFFLKGVYISDDWTVLLTHSKSEAFAALSKFTRIFILVLMLTLFVAFYLGSVQIRRNLVPLAKLKEGTNIISRGDFDYKVKVSSGDEFEELAQSFNTMSGHLQRQFRILSGMGGIIRAILSAHDRDSIIGAVVANLRGIIKCDQFVLFWVEPGFKNTLSGYCSNAEGKPPTRHVLSAAERERLDKYHHDSLLLGRESEFSNLLSIMDGDGLSTFALLPIHLRNNLGGVLALGYLEQPEHLQEDLLRARQIGDQIAVATLNADLIKDLDDLNWGTLTALARAVDANSHWTSGHSERVTELSIKIGGKMGMTLEEIEQLRRGALLHDIGKIAVPGFILDKVEKLTDEEFAMIKEHPAQGAVILEPIRPYREVVPIVAQHHEYYDGGGYPFGLAGERISLGARIVAVADVYDALLSDRPYRKGWELSRVIAHIDERAGQQFDPVVVQAFKDAVL
jgi:putative nucleotidyltransferase with HDIG domain